MWTAACVAFRRGQEVGQRVTVLGQNASARDAAFRAVADAADLARELLAGSPSPSVSLLTADHFVLPYCQVTDRHDNAEACKAICDTISDLLATHPASTCAIRWFPGTASFLPLERLQNIAIDAAARTAPDLLIAAPTVEALRVISRQEAFTDWEQIWHDNPRINPAYRALHHPPSNDPPDFVQGIATSSRPVFCTAIRLLTEHAFTGEYSARHRPRAPDPHGCQCSREPLQTPSHVIFHCALFRAARERHLRPASQMLSPNIIFGTKAGGEALAKFIEETQACVRPRRRDPPPEDHG
jgi:hypothetical protein